MGEKLKIEGREARSNVGVERVEEGKRNIGRVRKEGRTTGKGEAYEGRKGEGRDMIHDSS